MGIRHLHAPVEGVQFHPESVLTPNGPHLLANFLRLAGEGDASQLDDATGSFALAGFGGSAELEAVAVAASAAEIHASASVAAAGRGEAIR
jgi:hypothetical protein